MSGPLPRATADYREMLEDKDLDAVAVMTGWNSHIICSLDSLRAGKYTAVEVGTAYDISECYDLVAAAIRQPARQGHYRSAWRGTRRSVVSA